MAATAAARTDRRPASRARPARRAAPRARAAAAPPPTLRRARTNRLMPALAVPGRTAIAVGGIADSGLVFRLTRGRLWIGLLGVLLVGIVGLNVMALSFSASSSNAAREADDLERSNSALRAQMQMALSTEELEKTASKLALVVPAPGAYRYLKAEPGDAAAAAERLRAGEIAVAESAPTAEETLVSDPVVPVDPAATAAVDPAAVDPAAAVETTAPAAETAVAPVETTTPEVDAAPPAAALGGVAAP